MSFNVPLIASLFVAMLNWSVVIADSGPPKKDMIKQWIAQLGDRRASAREEASRALESAGREVCEREVERLLGSPDPEVSHRAQRLLEYFRLEGYRKELADLPRRIQLMSYTASFWHGETRFQCEGESLDYFMAFRIDSPRVVAVASPLVVGQCVTDTGERLRDFPWYEDLDARPQNLLLTVCSPQTPATKLFARIDMHLLVDVGEREYELPSLRRGEFEFGDGKLRLEGVEQGPTGCVLRLVFYDLKESFVDPSIRIQGATGGLKVTTAWSNDGPRLRATVSANRDANGSGRVSATRMTLTYYRERTWWTVPISFEGRIPARP